MATRPWPDPPAPDHGARREATLPPSGDGTVVMDIGGDVGALVLFTDPTLVGAEIDLFERDADQPFVHSAVRARHLESGSCFAAVYPGVPAGEYVIAAHGTRPATPVRIEGGRVTEVRA